MAGVVKNLFLNIQTGFDPVGINQSIQAFGALGAKAREVTDFISSNTVEAFISLETSMVGATKTIGLTVEQTKNLRNELLDVSATTGQTTENLAQIAMVGGQLGISANLIGDFTEQVNIMAQTFDMTGIQAGTAVAKITTAFGTSGMEGAFQRTGDIINELGNKTAASVKEIVRFQQQFAGAASILGIVQEESAALGAFFASLGLNAEDSARRMRSAFSFMLDPKKIGKFAQFLRVSEQGLRNLADKNIMAPIALLRDRIGSMTSRTEKFATVVTLFGKVGAQAMLPLLDKYDQYLRNLAIAKLSQGSMGREFGIIMQTVGKNIQIMVQSLRNFGVLIGEQLISEIRPAFDILAIAVGQFFQWLFFKTKEGGFQLTELGMDIVLMATDVAKAMLLIGSTVIFIAAVASAFIFLSLTVAAVLSPLGLMMLALGGILVAAILISRGFSDSWSEAFMTMFEFAKITFGQLGEMLKFIGGVINTIVTTVVGSVVTAVAGLIILFAKFKATITRIFFGIGDFITFIFRTAAKTVVSIVSFIVVSFLEGFGLMNTFFNKLSEGLAAIGFKSSSLFKDMFNIEQAKADVIATFKAQVEDDPARVREQFARDADIQRQQESDEGVGEALVNNAFQSMEDGGIAASIKNLVVDPLAGALNNVFPSMNKFGEGLFGTAEKIKNLGMEALNTAKIEKVRLDKLRTTGVTERKIQEAKNEEALRIQKQIESTRLGVFVDKKALKKKQKQAEKDRKKREREEKKRRAKNLRDAKAAKRLREKNRRDAERKQKKLDRDRDKAMKKQKKDREKAAKDKEKKDKKDKIPKRDRKLLGLDRPGRPIGPGRPFDPSTTGSSRLSLDRLMRRLSSPFLTLEERMRINAEIKAIQDAKRESDKLKDEQDSGGNFDKEGLIDALFDILTGEAKTRTACDCDCGG